MDITILVSKILGIYLVVAGLFLITKGKTIPHLLKDFFDHPALAYLTGVILILLSSIYLLQYNIWDGGFRMLITLLVWLVLIKGLVYIFYPKILSEATVKRFKGLFSVYGAIALIVGIALFFLV